MQNGCNVIVIADGRYDSPGHNACYCTLVAMVKHYNTKIRKTITFSGLCIKENNWFLYRPERPGKNR